MKRSLRIAVCTFPCLFFALSSLGQGIAAPGFAATDFATGFVNSGGAGPIGMAFDASGTLLVGNFRTGFIYTFGPAGGVATAATQVNASAIPGGIAGLAFTQDGRLYGVRQSSSDVVEIDPATATVIRTVAAGLAGATALAVDPLSGDLFVSTVTFGNTLFRVSNFAATPGTVTVYLPAALDGLAFGADGTLYGAAFTLSDLALITGTDKPQPATLTLVASGIGFIDGLAISADPNSKFVYANRNNGIVTKIDLGTTPPTLSDIFSGGTRGDFAAVGPDGCLYITQTDRVVKITNANGTCKTPPLGPLTPTTTVPPIAADDTATTTSDTAVTIPVLANDSDAGGNTPLKVDSASVTQPRSGAATVTVNADNTLTYNPAGFVGSDTFTYRNRNTLGTLSNLATVTATVSRPNTPPDLTIAKTHAGSFTQGQTGATYTIAVSNAGQTPTSGLVTVTDTVPPGLISTAISGTGWACTQPSGPCTRSDALGGGLAYPVLTLTANVANNAPASITNSASVAGGGDANAANNTSNDLTTIAAGPDLTLSKSHVGSFSQGQTGATYTITVGNAGVSPTSGVVTVADNVPSGLTATGIAGAGWTCTQPMGPCTRSDALTGGLAYPILTLIANVASNAPASVTNTATVSGGGDVNATNDTASDVTTILATSAAPPDLTIAKTHVGDFHQGQTGATYTITVTNVGQTPTSGLVRVTDTLPKGLTATAIAGTGWTCKRPSDSHKSKEEEDEDRELVTCTRSDALGGGLGYPDLTLTVNVARNARASVTNVATVAGGGDMNPDNNIATDPTSVTAITQPPEPVHER